MPPPFGLGARRGGHKPDPYLYGHFRVGFRRHRQENAGYSNGRLLAITCAVPERFHYFCEQETSGKCLEWVRDHLAVDEIGIYLEKISVADDPESGLPQPVRVS